MDGFRDFCHVWPHGNRKSDREERRHVRSVNATSRRSPLGLHGRLWAVRGRGGIAWNAAASIACSPRVSAVAPVESHRSSRSSYDKREAVMKSGLLSALVLSALLWP